MISPEAMLLGEFGRATTGPMYRKLRARRYSSTLAGIRKTSSRADGGRRYKQRGAISRGGDVGNRVDLFIYRRPGSRAGGDGWKAAVPYRARNPQIKISEASPKGSRPMLLVGQVDRPNLISGAQLLTLVAYVCQNTTKPRNRAIAIYVDNDNSGEPLIRGGSGAEIIAWLASRRWRLTQYLNMEVRISRL